MKKPNRELETEMHNISQCGDCGELFPMFGKPHKCEQKKERLRSEKQMNEEKEKYPVNEKFEINHDKPEKVRAMFSTIGGVVYPGHYSVNSFTGEISLYCVSPENEQKYLKDGYESLEGDEFILADTWQRIPEKKSEKEEMKKKQGFIKELRQLINRHSIDNMLNTPDYILAELINSVLVDVEKMLRERVERNINQIEE